MLFEKTDTAKRLDDLLDLERGMILSGKITQLAAVTHQKNHLIARQMQAGDAEVLERLRAKAERNQALLVAAAQGLRSASKRIGAITAGNVTLRTYGADGAAHEMGRSPREDGINHRA